MRKVAVKAKRIPTARLDKFSERQKEAVGTFGADLSVSAGPGSGKTTVLVERFLHASTQHGAWPERILAITFTEKAAQEMKSRLVKACGESGLASLRRRIENAPVSTIDSFCARLLKENPIEAGVDPYFQILGEGESEMLMERLLDGIFEAQTEGSFWIKLLADYGEDSMRNLLKEQYLKVRTHGGGEQLLKFDSRDPLMSQASMNIVDLASRIMEETSGGCANDTESSMREGAGELLAVLKTTDSTSWALYHRVEQACGKIKKRGRLKACAEEIGLAAEFWLQCATQQMSVPHKAEFVRVYGLFESAYEAEKRLLAAYDFTDLLYKAYKLLSGQTSEKKHLRAYYQNFYSHIMVDEYQDTSPLQAQLIDHLRGKDNLFIVGDAMQSIYGFRQADPRILRQRSDTSRRVLLKENYRSRPEIIDFVNTFFSSISQEGEFEELKARRESRGEGSLELLCVVREAEDMETTDEARVIEARTIARRIRSLVAGGYAVTGKDGVSRPIRYGDIAILLRSTTPSPFYEKELLDHGIPHYVVKGKGFYDKPEIKDLVHFLKWLENPDLDISLAGILRSPLFGLSEDALFWMARAAKEVDSHAPLFHALRQPERIKNLPPFDREALGAFLRLSAHLREQKNRYGISQILEELMQRTCYEAKLLTLPQGRRKIANVRKLVEMARCVEDKNIFGVGDFVRYVEGLAARETREEEAKTEPESGDAVVVSSIHAAKGLEYECVIVADMGRSNSSRQEARFISSAAEGMGAVIKNPLTSEMVVDFSYARIRQEARAAEKAEETRLLFVAMTRARELLILSGSCIWDAKKGQMRRAGSWMGQVIKALGDQAVRQERIEYAGTSILRLEPFYGEPKKADPVKRPADMASVRKKISQAETILPAEAVSCGLGFEGAGEFEKRFAMAHKPYTFTHDTSVTELLKKESRDEEPDRPFLAVGDEEALPRNEFGTLFHQAMEFSLRRFQSGKSLGAGFFEPQLRVLGTEEKKEMIKGILGFWKSALGKDARKALKAYPELPFIYKTPYGMLRGQMDLVYLQKEGGWVILDYKTNKITQEQLQKTAQQYEFQIALYALVFYELYGQIPHKGVLYFSSIDRAHEIIFSSEKLEKVKERLHEALRELA